MDPIDTATVLTIRECGYDEYWLRDRIFDDPASLGLGDLQAVMKEKSQSRGGRLDLLLKNPEDDSMFEVEVQLGPTDESHIIRTIEYWDSMKRKWPSRSHTAVLVAETITNRFFNIVHLLGQAVPIIGLQVSIVQVGGVKGLHFTKIIDSYEEPEEEEIEQRAFDEEHWKQSNPGTLACARWYRALLESIYGEVPVKYFETYIAFSVGSRNRVWVNARRNERASVELKFGEAIFQEVVDYLNKNGISFRSSRGKYITFNVNAQQLKDQLAVHQWLALRLSPEDQRRPAT